MAKKKPASEQTSRPFWVEVSHDLGQPVQGLTYLSAILSEQPLDPHQRKLVDAISECVGELEAMLGHLRNLIHLEEGLRSPQIQTIDIHPLLANVAKNFASVLEERKSQLYWQSVQGQVQTDPQLLECVLFNLLLNTIEFGANGDIVLSAEKRGKELVIAVTFTCEDTLDRRKAAIFFKSLEQSSSTPADGKTRKKAEGEIAMGLGMLQRYADMLDYELCTTSLDARQMQFQLTLSLV